ncbi:hypothetical protein Z043_114821 [Scleropages formosus]|uniref:C1q domain-containing protein n=1 Tax=Scleropages formosus TaxID=113540 RepID=A0A0P7U9B1_SCLFO|nr:hypothetical protein Z043_114821 [Scleropages formosus]
MTALAILTCSRSVNLAFSAVRNANHGVSEMNNQIMDISLNQVTSQRVSLVHNSWPIISTFASNQDVMCKAASNSILTAMKTDDRTYLKLLSRWKYLPFSGFLLFPL